MDPKIIGKLSNGIAPPNKKLFGGIVSPNKTNQKDQNTKFWLFEMGVLIFNFFSNINETFKCLKNEFEVTFR